MASNTSPPYTLTPSELKKRANLTDLIDNYVEPYLRRNPRARSAVNALFPRNETSGDMTDSNLNHSQNPKWDHLAFRSFDCVDGGLDAVACVFQKHGYTYQGSLSFKAKKVEAKWFAPPSEQWAKDLQSGENIFPRLFVSHVEVGQLSTEAQLVIKKRQAYCDAQDEVAGVQGVRKTFVASTGGVPWILPATDASKTFIETNEISISEYETLSNESEYAAWTLINGHALNHVAIAVHGLFSHDMEESEDLESRALTSRIDTHTRRFTTLEDAVAFLQKSPHDLPMSTAGGTEVKVSPDGLLRQASTVADEFEFQFRIDPAIEIQSHQGETVTKKVPSCYVEFVERLPIDETLQSENGFIPENKRRDGFETANADAIFESTFSEQRER